jgi:hypothetical protein
MQVVPFPLLDTVERCFFETLVPAKFSVICQLGTMTVFNEAYSLGPRWTYRGAISRLQGNSRNEQRSA